MLLVKGADYLISGASSLAHRLGIRPIVIGLTIVAFGTSAPELAVNLVSVWAGQTDIAISNIIGSNIANILLILGASALITTLAIRKQTVWKEIPLALLASAMPLILASDRWLNGAGTNEIGRTDGVILLILFTLFLYYTYSIGGAEGKGDDFEIRPWYISAGLALMGITGLTFGGKLVVDGAVAIAQSYGISERVIGLTIVAIGTSLPELVTSLTAAYRGHADIAVGNVVGSNIFNVFLILGISSFIRPLPLSAAAASDVLVAVAATLALFLAMFVGRRHMLERWQGGVLVALYLAYLILIVL